MTDHDRPRGYYLAGIRNARVALEQAEAQLAAKVNDAIEHGCSYDECAAVLEVGRTTLWRRYRWTQQTLDV